MNQSVEAVARLSDDDVQAIDALRQSFERLKSELGRVIVGQHAVVEELAVCLFARGHALLMGVPGLAKTLLVSKLAETMSLDFSRIQFTPDLMPMDITGTDILQDTGSGRREFQFVRGPIFANIVLADEINRAPPKTQAALLEAMQEYRVTALGKTFELTRPFLVLATQNPIEQEGTYPLPEAQLDRFMYLIELDYPSEADRDYDRAHYDGRGVGNTRFRDVGRADLAPPGVSAAPASPRPHLYVRGQVGSPHTPQGIDCALLVAAARCLGCRAAGRAESDSGGQGTGRPAGQLYGKAGGCGSCRRTRVATSHHHDIRRASRGDHRQGDCTPISRGDRCGRKLMFWQLAIEEVNTNRVNSERLITAGSIHFPVVYFERD